MPQTTVAPKPCRVHRFDDHAVAIRGVRMLADGYGERVDRKLYQCTGCGFPMTMPLEG
jgi:hypothetical protein